MEEKKVVKTSKSTEENSKRKNPLARNLRPDEIEVKIKAVGENYVQVLLYKTARVDMDILDEVFGIGGWQSDYKEIKGNLYAGIGVRGKDGTWVWKWDCGVESRADGEGNEKKGEASDAFKRAGFKWGIGRALYTCPPIFIVPEVLGGVGKNDRGVWKLRKNVRLGVKNISYKPNGDIWKITLIDSKNKVVWSNMEEKVEKNESNK